LDLKGLLLRRRTEGEGKAERIGRKRPKERGKGGKRRGSGGREST